MPTPEEISKIINPPGFSAPNGHPRLRRVLSIVAFVLLAGGVIVGGITLLRKYQPSVVTNIENVIAKKASTSQAEIENMGTYLRYRPASFTTTTVKRMIFVIPPGGDEPEVRDFIVRWSAVAQEHGYSIASIVDWDRASILAFLGSARATQGVSKVYLSGFSNGGYNSCGAGLEFPQLVDGIIPMGAFCRTNDAVGQGSGTMPILAVIGSEDTWALGDDGQLPYQLDNELTVEYLIVPHLGHSFPTSAMGQVANWIEKH